MCSDWPVPWKLCTTSPICVLFSTLALALRAFVNAASNDLAQRRNARRCQFDKSAHCLLQESTTGCIMTQSLTSTGACATHDARSVHQAETPYSQHTKGGVFELVLHTALSPPSPLPSPHHKSDFRAGEKLISCAGGGSASRGPDPHPPPQKKRSLFLKFRHFLFFFFFALLFKVVGLGGRPRPPPKSWIPPPRIRRVMQHQRARCFDEPDHSDGGVFVSGRVHCACVVRCVYLRVKSGHVAGCLQHVTRCH